MKLFKNILHFLKKITSFLTLFAHQFSSSAPAVRNRFKCNTKIYKNILKNQFNNETKKKN